MFLYQHHGWDVVVVYFNKHGTGTSVHTYGTPGAGLKFVGSDKSNASKYGRVTTKLFKQFAKNSNNDKNNDIDNNDRSQ